MSDSFSKKENAKKKAKKQQEKALRREDRKINNNKGKGFDNMIAYLNEDGNLTSTPPDLSKRKEINPDDILLGATPIEEEKKERTGVVSFFSQNGYGFIIDDESHENIFVHSNQLSEPLKEKDKVIFEKERTPKGYNAINVKKIK
ncbi:cold-shock protein [Flavobacterium sediminis]|uniref:Cold-shock protein n=1 Tax=Flavobacterium sediminis TaxID=2201181 RepID=A0A2U8QQV3_9FLAO|nr:cold shock domain-containing protein [Flavobacterium sediminis]AWM12439.1 cold-shock protein [Flavobacterium sediminis]